MDVQVIILAGGKGERLRPLTVERPKALCPICNVPVLARLLPQLVDAGLSEAVVMLPKCSDEALLILERTAPPGFSLRPDVRDVLEPGSVPAARRGMTDQERPVLVIYGDSLIGADFRRLLVQHEETRRSGGRVTMLVHRPADLEEPNAEGRTYHGVLGVDRDGWVVAFEEKPLVSKIVPGFDLANAAVFVLEPDLLRDYAEARDFSYHLFAPLVANERSSLRAHDIGDGFRMDIGSISRYFSANLMTLERQLPTRPPGVEGPPGVWHDKPTSVGAAELVPPVLVGMGASIESGARVGPRAVIGEGSRIGPGAKIEDSVLLNDCVVGARCRIQRAVLGPHTNVHEDAILPPGTAAGAYSRIGMATF
jgi:mannose-1-phosphate guanylyltransferase/phosphomannomutase